MPLFRSSEVVLAWIGFPFSWAPWPTRAVKVSSTSGAWTTAAIGWPSSTMAMLIDHQGLYFMKATVPSMGSTTNRRLRSRRAGSSAVSSDSQP